jgi:gas vesicle protein
MKTSNSILGVLGGIGIGVALGVLFAPDKGTATRKKISEKGTDLTDELKSKFDDIVKLLEGIVSTSETKGKEYLNDGKALIEQINKDVVNEFK